MSCKDLRLVRLDEIAANVRAPADPHWEAHCRECPSCAQFEREIRGAVESLRPKHPISARPGFREKVIGGAMEILSAETGNGAEAARRRRWHRFVLWPAIAVAAAILLLAIVPAVRDAVRSRAFDRMPAAGLVSSAIAADRTAFGKAGIIHIVDQILLPAIDQPELAAGRWLPLVEVRASGAPQADMLTLATDPGRSAEARDESWYDVASGRFSRVIVRDGRAVFGNGYDGGAVYELGETPGAGNVVRRPILPGFEPPTAAAGILGVAGRLPGDFMHGLPPDVKDLGRVRLWDGNVARVVRLGTPGEGHDSLPVMLVKIRRKDATLAEMEWRIGDKPWLIVRRLRLETVPEPGLAWNLDGIGRFGSAPTAVGAPGLPGVLKGLVDVNATVQSMVGKSDFETYVIWPAPGWAEEMHVIDAINPIDLNHRVFAIVYRAPDGRHVVISESSKQTEALEPALGKMPVVYTSPSGNRLHSVPDSERWARSLLEGAQPITGEWPGTDAVSYVVETKSGIIAFLAVNGHVPDEDLHTIIDHVVPARSLVE